MVQKVNLRCRKIVFLLIDIKVALNLVTRLSLAMRSCLGLVFAHICIGFLEFEIRSMKNKHDQVETVGARQLSSSAGNSIDRRLSDIITVSAL